MSFWRMETDCRPTVCPMLSSVVSYWKCKTQSQNVSFPTWLCRSQAALFGWITEFLLPLETQGIKWKCLYLLHRIFVEIMGIHAREKGRKHLPQSKNMELSISHRRHDTAHLQFIDEESKFYRKLLEKVAFKSQPKYSNLSPVGVAVVVWMK